MIGAFVDTAPNAKTANDCLSRLQIEVLEFANRLPDSWNDPSTDASRWAKTFVSLGQELRRLGMVRQLVDVTIGAPSDNIAIDVLRLASSAGAGSADPAAFPNLAARLEVILSVDANEKRRFVLSLKNVMQRLTMFHC